MLFLDESGWWRIDQVNKYTESDFFILGGAIIKESNYIETEQSFLKLKSDLLPKEVVGLPLHAVELNNINSKSDKNRYKNYINGDRGKDILKEIYIGLSKLKLEAIAIIIDNVALREKYSAPEDPYLISYKFINEKFQSIISKRNEKENVFGIVNLSYSNQRLSAKIGQVHDGLTSIGTEYSDLSKILPKVNIRRTSESYMFEIADLICYAHQRAYRNWLCNKYGKPLLEEESYLSLIKPLHEKITIGRYSFNGIHIKIFPHPRVMKKKTTQ